jgi:anhydro-N-acetylmuramic acid kinase
MIVAGVMSGTSADGIDVALVDLRGRGLRTRLRLLAHHHVAFPAAVRGKILRVMNATAPVADLARLNFLLGELYAAAVASAQRRAKIRAQLVGCHGQTIFHQGERAIFLGQRIAATWQTGEAAVIAQRLRVPVVSDFRPADLAAGGKGAPLVPLLDYLLFRDARRGRTVRGVIVQGVIVQNLGGIANLTAIPAGASPEEVIAFDTGPGNMVIDALVQELFGKPFDRDGRIAAGGRVLEAPLRWALNLPFFRRPPPRTAGREEFGREFVAEFLRHVHSTGGRAPKADIIATATQLTASSIANAIGAFVLSKGDYSDYFLSGGGTRNRALMQMLAATAAALGLRLRSTDELGIPSQAKEAVAFAVLAYQTWHRRPSNLPSATGAKRPTILGKISYA